MEVALSTKHFNMPVKADDPTLDYRSYVRGLLHCPVCHEAVFFRKSHERNGKRIKNSFAHYSGNPDSCELRVKQAQGRELLEKAKIESHGQRLQYYNDHLWDMAKSHIVVDKRSRNWLRKLLGDRFFNNACRDLRA